MRSRGASPTISVASESFAIFHIEFILQLQFVSILLVLGSRVGKAKQLEKKVSLGAVTTLSPMCNYLRDGITKVSTVRNLAVLLTIVA